MLGFQEGLWHELLGKVRGTELKPSVCSFFLNVLTYLQRPFAYSVYLFNDKHSYPPYPPHTHTLGIAWGKQLILKPWQLDKAI